MGSDTFRTTIEMLQFRANENGNMVAFTFADKPYTYAQMWDKINAFGSYLQSLDLVPTDRILMAIPNSPEFFWAFYGIQRMGGIAVPLFPNSSPERVFSIAETCRAKVVVAPEHLTETQIAEFKKAGLSRGIQVIKVSESTNPIRVNRFPEIQPDDIAFIQYTSGSTGTPKGVMISQDNLLVNIAQMTSGMRITSNDIFVSWLPVYHDMGLILMTMAPFYSGTIVHLYPPIYRISIDG